MDSEQNNIIRPNFSGNSRKTQERASTGGEVETLVSPSVLNEYRARVEKERKSQDAKNTFSVTEALLLKIESMKDPKEAFQEISILSLAFNEKFRLAKDRMPKDESAWINDRIEKVVTFLRDTHKYGAAGNDATPFIIDGIPKIIPVMRDVNTALRRSLLKNSFATT